MSMHPQKPHNEFESTSQAESAPSPAPRPPALLALGHYALAIAVFVGTLPGLVACAHPHRESADRANEIAELSYEDPQRAATQAAAEIDRLLNWLDNRGTRKVGDIEDEETGEEREVRKYRRDYFWDRHSMALCQNYLSLGRANAAMGANEAAQRAFQQAIDAADMYVGEHIRYVMDAEPEVFRTIKAYYRSKKIEVTAYTNLRDLARRSGNEALATVYDIRARYAKMYLDSALALEEMDVVTQWEEDSASQDDRRFRAIFWFVFSLVVVVGALVLAVAYFLGGRPGVRQVLGVGAAIIVAALVLAVLVHVYQRAQESIDATALAGLDELNQFIERVRDIPELAALPEFDKFRESLEETQRHLDEGNAMEAARAFLDSYIHLTETEQELSRLRGEYESDTPGTGAPGPS